MLNYHSSGIRLVIIIERKILTKIFVSFVQRALYTSIGISSELTASLLFYLF